MKKYYTPDIQLETLSQTDVIMASYDVTQLGKGEYIAGVGRDWFAMGMDIN